MRVLRRVVKWTLISVGLLVVLGIVLAIVGSGKTNKTAATSARQARSTVAPRRGDRSRPVPLRAPMRLSGQWRMSVRSVVLDADHVISNRTDSQTGLKDQGPPSPGAQYVMIGVSLQYVGGGSSSPEGFLPRIRAMGKHNAPYEAHCIPPAEVTDQDVFSGQTVTGNLCFEVAQNDVRTLGLYVEPIFGATGRRVWFALR